jgi:hypothetical protein
MNRFVYSITTSSVVIVLAAISGGCEAQKSSNPLSPAVAGPIAGVDITAPKLLEPAQGFKFKENQQPIKLVIANSNTTGVRAITYIFEVASDNGFATKVFARSGVLPGDGGRTSVQVDALELGHSYYWRARAEDGANSSIYSSAEFSVLPRAVLTVPTPASPVNGEVLTTRRPTLRVNNATKNEAVGAVGYYFNIALDQAFTQLVWTGATPEGNPTQITIDHDLDPSTTHYWRVYANDGEAGTPWSPTAVFRTPAAPTGGGGGGGGGGGSTNGCVNGRLSDPETWFFKLIGRAKGSDASDWFSVLSRSGIPDGLGPGQKPAVNAPLYGITQQSGAGGPRGRLFLPTETPDENGYFTRPVDILESAGGGLRWTWKEWSGPAYVPRACQ